MEYRPSGICASNIHVEVKDDIVEDVAFTGGCPGNHLGIEALVKGMKVDDVISRLSGIRCGFKESSCPDQLACALRVYKENKA